MPDLLEPTPLAEFYLVIRPDGTCRLAATKLDPAENGDGSVGRIYEAALHELTRWAASQGAHIGLVVGDGGPDYIKLKARLYAMHEELVTLRARMEATP